MIDIAIPNNNEKEFIVMAGKLGFKGICFLYDSDDYLNKPKQSEIDTKKIKIYTGVLANKRNIYKVKNRIKNEKIFVAIRSSNNDKEIIEKSNVNVIFSLEDNARRDFIHQRASGLNHVLCKSAVENNVIIGFSMKSILNSENKYVILGRIIQNIKICRKFKVRTIIASFAEKPFEMGNAHDLISLFRILGLRESIFLKEEDI